MAVNHLETGREAPVGVRGRGMEAQGMAQQPAGHEGEDEVVVVVDP